MTNSLAITLGVIVIGFFAVDYAMMDAQVAVFAGRRGLDLIEFISFWR